MNEQLREVVNNLKAAAADARTQFKAGEGEYFDGVFDAYLHAADLVAAILPQQPEAVNGDGLESALIALVAGPYHYHHKMDNAAEREGKAFDRCRELTIQNIRTWCATQRAINLAKQPEAGGAVNFDIVALQIASRFTQDTEPQRRANLQVAVIEAMRYAACPTTPTAADARDGYDAWAANPYTKVLMTSIETDYIPKADARDGELPGMWSVSDFTGGDPDERSHSHRQLLADAESFRWLRDNRRAAIPEFEGGWDVIEYVDGGEREYCSNAMTLEAAIAKDKAADAARSQSDRSGGEHARDD